MNILGRRDQKYPKRHYMFGDNIDHPAIMNELAVQYRDI